jgi:hypothetical protein
MTKQEFEKVTSDLHRAASQHGINLADPANPSTVWIENPTGSGEYSLFAQPRSLEQAMSLAGSLEVIIRTTQAGRVQIIVWKDSKWFDAYADERPIGGG